MFKYVKIKLYIIVDVFVGESGNFVWNKLVVII